LAGPARPQTTGTTKDPQDGNHPEREDGKDFRQSRRMQLLMTLENPVVL
jgi:hypothetical protein